METAALQIGYDTLGKNLLCLVFRKVTMLLEHSNFVPGSKFHRTSKVT